jgi:DNA-binding PadR family transcriptional regulator
MATTWTESDEPTLRWLRDQGPSFLPEPWSLELGLRRSVEPSEAVPGLDSAQMDQALTRLREHGLIDGQRNETIGYAFWSGLRITARGMQVLGEWPDLDHLTSAVGIKMLLDELAKSAVDAEDQGALRRMVGVIGEIGEGIALNTLNTAAGEVSGD